MYVPLKCIFPSYFVLNEIQNTSDAGVAFLYVMFCFTQGRPV